MHITQDIRYVGVNDRKIELTPDKIVMIPPLVNYSTRCEKPFLHSYFFLKHADHLDIGYPKELVIPADRKFLEAIEHGKNDPESAGIHLYSVLLDLYCTATASRPENRNSSFDMRIARVLEEIAVRDKQDCSSEELAKICKLSVSAFNHLFTRLVGTAPAQYVTRFFLEKARIILEDRRHTIDEAATAAGYSDRYAFSHAYKKLYGISPGAVKKSSDSKKI